MEKSHTALIIDPSQTARKTLTSLMRQYFKMQEIYSAATASEAPNKFDDASFKT